MTLLYLALTACLALAACTPQRNTRSTTAQPGGRSAPATQFRPLATLRQLGAPYLAAGAARAISRIHSDSGCSALLIEMQPGEALWVDLTRAAQTTALELRRELLAVDMERRQAYAQGAVNPGEPIELYRRPLPLGSWQPLLAEGKRLPRGQVLDLLINPGQDKVVLMLRTNFSPGGSSGGDPTAPPEGRVRLWDCAYTIDPQGQPLLLWQRGLLLPVDEMLAPSAFALLADGSLAYCAPDSAEIELIPPMPGAASQRFPLDPGRRCRLGADASQPLAWAYLAPENSGSGTGRANNTVQPGMLLVFGSQGEVDRMACGQVPMGDFSGDWEQRRCVLSQPSVGVAVADFARHELRWPLRQSGAEQLYLAGSGRQILNVLPDAIVGIGAADLASLGSALAASQVLPREELRQVRPVAEGLGWDWGSTQISPLLASTGRLTMFDGKDVASSLAEFEWDKEAGRVSRLLLTRIPVLADEALLKLDAAALDAQLRGLLRSMGWPQAARDPQRGFDTDGELKAVYLLQPAPLAAGDNKSEEPVAVEPGEFSVWITADAALWSLEPAGDPLPQGSRLLEPTRKLAHSETLKLALADGMLEPQLRVALTARGGWITPDPDVPAEEQLLELADRQTDGSQPAIEIEVLASDAQQDQLYRLLLHAVDDRLLQSGSRSAGALLLAQAGQLFGPADEFTPAQTPPAR